MARVKYEFEKQENAWFKQHTFATERDRIALVGTAEAAAILGVERPRIGRWIGKGVMPQPVAKVGATPLWLREDVEAMRKEVAKRRRAAGENGSVREKAPAAA